MYFGGNRAGMKTSPNSPTVSFEYPMKTILVKPLSEKKDYMVTKLLRGNEKKVLKEYKKYIDEKGEIWKEKL